MTRAVNGRFVAGASGNPGGRPKELPGIRELAAQHTEAAVAALVRALDDPKTSVPAAVALLDRAWGKPQQSLDIKTDVASQQVAAPDIMALIAKRQTAVAQDAIKPILEAAKTDNPPRGAGLS